MPATSPARPRALALGLILPLALAGAAVAEPASTAPSSWVDPPARPAAAAPKEPSKAAGPLAAKPAPEDEALPKAAATPAAKPRRALALERPARPEAAPSHPRAPHPSRLADTPAALGPAAGAASERAAAARSLAADYIATVSGSDAAMVGGAARFYGTRVRFYGRPTTLAGLVAEKRSFVRRWPQRRYAPRVIRTACDAQTCTVRAIVDFRATNPGRGAVSSGAAELVLEVRFSGSRPVIVAESGRVLRRDAQAGALAPAGGRA